MRRRFAEVRLGVASRVISIIVRREPTAQHLEQSVEWFADHFYSAASIFERLLLNSRVGLWWNIPRNVGYRLALGWRSRVDFDSKSEHTLATAEKGEMEMPSSAAARSL